MFNKRYVLLVKIQDMVKRNNNKLYDHKWLWAKVNDLGEQIYLYKSLIGVHKVLSFSLGLIFFNNIRSRTYSICIS